MPFDTAKDDPRQCPKMDTHHHRPAPVAGRVTMGSENYARVTARQFEPRVLDRGAAQQEAAPCAPRVSRVVLVLTLSMASREGHLAYRSQSDNPLQGTTLGGSPDDPRRQRTRNAPAGHAARAGTRQRQRGLPGAGDLAHPVLPVAPALRALWRRRRASATAAGAPWTPGAGPSRGRAAGAQRGHQLGDLGLRADRGVPHAQLAAERGSKYGAAGLAASRLGHAARAADGARA